MHNLHARNTVRYYILLIILLVFLFFSNDFGLLDVQKTALVTAVGIDRAENTFVVTSQIAIPQSSKQGNATEAVQIVSRGKTVADAFEEINAKTGWYPKLVFCNLIVLGESTCQENVFDVLEYFLRDEYLTDNCQIVACDGLAKDLLNTAALVDSSSGAAITKILSAHAARVGSVLPSTLREFSIGYFGDSQSGYLPLVKTQPQQETIGEEQTPPAHNSAEQNGPSEQPSDSAKQNKPVFSAEETALFVRGKRIGKLTSEETFAFNAVKNSLQLAPYSLSNTEYATTLTIKQNSQKLSLKIGQDGKAELKIQLTLTAGILDSSKALPLDKIQDAGDVPDGVFADAEKKLSGEISTLFEKTRALNCDIFGVRELLMKHKPRKFHRYADTLFQDTLAQVTVRFRGVR